jgi:hypothetical protein
MIDLERFCLKITPEGFDYLRSVGILRTAFSGIASPHRCECSSSLGKVRRYAFSIVPMACRSFKTEDRVYKRFRNRRVTAPSGMHVLHATMHGAHQSSNSSSSTQTPAQEISLAHMHTARKSSRTFQETPGPHERFRDVSGRSETLHQSAKQSGRLQKVPKSHSRPEAGQSRHDNKLSSSRVLQAQSMGRSSWVKMAGAFSGVQRMK